MKNKNEVLSFLVWLQQKAESKEIFMTEQTVRIVASYAVDYFDEKESRGS